MAMELLVGEDQLTPASETLHGQLADDDSEQAQAITDMLDRYFVYMRAVDAATNITRQAALRDQLTVALAALGGDDAARQDAQAFARAMHSRVAAGGGRPCQRIGSSQGTR